VHQGFFDWRIQGWEEETVTLRLGRQKVGFGSGLLIAPAEGLNLRRSMDGASIAVKKGRMEYRDAPPGLDLTKRVWRCSGPHAVVLGHRIYHGAPVLEIVNIGIYYLGFDHKHPVFAKGIGREIRETAGVRTWKYFGDDWDYDNEGLVQWGTFRGAPIRAWAFSENIGYTFGNAPLRPRLGFRSDATSGDLGLQSRDLSSFDPLFAAVPLYSGPDPATTHAFYSFIYSHFLTGLALTTGKNPVPETKQNWGYRYEPDKFAVSSLTQADSMVVAPRG